MLTTQEPVHPWTLQQNPATDRWDLHERGRLVLSSVSRRDCLYRANEHGVLWNSTQNNGFTPEQAPDAYRKIAEIAETKAVAGLRKAADAAEKAGGQLSPNAGSAMAAFMLSLFLDPQIPTLLRAFCEHYLLARVPVEAVAGIRARAKLHAERDAERRSDDRNDEAFQAQAAEELCKCLLESQLDRNGLRAELPSGQEPPTEVAREVYQFISVTKVFEAWLQRLVAQGDSLTTMGESSVEELATQMGLLIERADPQVAAASR